MGRVQIGPLVESLGRAWKDKSNHLIWSQESLFFYLYSFLMNVFKTSLSLLFFLLASNWWLYQWNTDSGLTFIWLIQWEFASVSILYVTRVHFAQAVTWYYGYLDLKAFPAFQKVQSFFYRWKETLAKVVQTKHLWILNFKLQLARFRSCKLNTSIHHLLTAPCNHVIPLIVHLRCFL